MKRLSLPLAIAVFVLSAACAHTAPGPANDPAWTGAWTNLVPVNHTGQTFTTVAPRINSIDLDILTGNPGRAPLDTLTLTVFDGPTPLGHSAVSLHDGADGWTRFTFTPAIRVRPRMVVKMELADTGLVLLGWRYGGNTYPDGVAILLGVEHPEFDFRFRVNAP